MISQLAQVDQAIEAIETSNEWQTGVIDRLESQEYKPPEKLYCLERERQRGYRLQRIEKILKPLTMLSTSILFLSVLLWLFAVT
jgi:hypothetical protein